MMLQSHGVAGLGNTTVTVAGQQITVDPEGNWVQPVQCYLFASEVWDPGDCTPPSAATLLAANNAANIGGAASQGSVAAATGNMNATDSAAAGTDPCYASDSPTLCSMTGGLVGGNGATCILGTSQTNSDGSVCCAMGGMCVSTLILTAAAGIAAILLFGAMNKLRTKQ